MADFHALDRLAGRQQGLATTDQLHDLGFSDSEIATLVAKGILQRVTARRGVFRLCGARQTRDQALLAAILAARHDVVLGGLSAADHWGFPAFPHPAAIELLGASDHRIRLTGVRARRTIELPALHRTVLRGVPVTSAERTFVDVCGSVPYGVLERAGDELRRRRKLHIPRLQRVVEEAPASGRRTIRPVLTYLAAHERDVGDNDGELDVLKILRQAGVTPLPQQQVRVRVGGKSLRIDHGYRLTREGFEFMGFDPHGTLVSVFHNDADRTRWLQQAGWRLWPITSRTSEDELVSLAWDLARAEREAEACRSATGGRRVA